MSDEQRMIDSLGSKRVYISVVFFSLFLQCHATQLDSECIAWFKAGKIKPESKSCILDCSTLMVDLTTFICPNQCEILCKTRSYSLGKVVYYPGLTPAKKKLVEKNPGDAFIVFTQKTRAEWSSGNHFPEQGLNDEGDAFRHFIWAGLLTKELGKEKAKKFLDAHEANPLQPNSERNMDQFNNEKGILAAESLILNTDWSLENLEKLGLESLHSKSLKVLTPGLKIPEVQK